MRHFPVLREGQASLPRRGEGQSGGSSLSEVAKAGSNVMLQASFASPRHATPAIPVAGTVQSVEPTRSSPAHFGEQGPGAGRRRVAGGSRVYQLRRPFRGSLQHRLRHAPSTLCIATKLARSVDLRPRGQRRDVPAPRERTLSGRSPAGSLEGSTSHSPPRGLHNRWLPPCCPASRLPCAPKSTPGQAA